MEGNFYRDLAYVFGAAMAGGYLAKWLRQPLILGYLVGGIAIGPFTPGFTLSQIHQFELLAEIGVMLLMYSIGLEFSFRELLKVKLVAILGGPLGIILSIGLSLLVGKLMNWPMAQSIAIGAVVSVASTMVLSRFLLDRGELHSPHGRVMIGITLVEDLAVVVLTVLLPAWGKGTGSHVWALGIALGKALLILMPLIFLAAKILPGVMARVSKSESDELYLLTVVAMGFITAALTQALGLSLALGAFLAGVMLSESDTSHKMLSKLLPLRDAFVALFFVTIGALVDPRVLIHEPLLWIVIVLMTVGGKLAIWSGVTRLFGFPWKTALLVGMGLTQIGEFSYVLVKVAHDAKLVGSDVYNATLAASVVTILLNSVLMKTLPAASHKAA
jgi:CPA2 family monovalent cation:H+ antiporter-2